MRVRQFTAVAGLLFICSTVLAASQPRDKALWIEVKEKGDHKTTIAVTELIARQIIESDETNVHFAKKGKQGLITREMLRSVLDGREESVEVRDEDGSEAKLFMADLKVPGNKGGEGEARARDVQVGLPDVPNSSPGDRHRGVG